MRGVGYRRVDLQALAEARLVDAQVLAAHQRFSAAYYLSGYAVELGLKSCISRQFSAETIPDPALVSKIYVHDFTKLTHLAGLASQLSYDQKADPDFAGNWGTVSEWTEAIRYETVDSYTCTKMLSAVSDDKHGVLRWLKQHW